MNGIVVIPAFDRPGFLEICLEYIVRADKSDQLKYVICLDHGHDHRCKDVIKDFPYDHAILERKSKIIGVGKQSNNVLMGLLAGYNHSDGPIFYIEDDVFIGKDFFTFGHELLQQEPDVLCAILSRNVNTKDKLIDDNNAYYIKDNTNVYQGIGSIFNRKMFGKYIKPHVCPEYVMQPMIYCRVKFKSKTLGDAYCEQDGLIRRIIEKNKLPVAFSHVPRCFHAGFYGYHRLNSPHVRRLPINSQVKYIKDIAFNVDKLRKVAVAENLVTDSMPVRLDTTHEKLIKK